MTQNVRPTQRACTAASVPHAPHAPGCAVPAQHDPAGAPKYAYWTEAIEKAPQSRTAGGGGGGGGGRGGGGGAPARPGVVGSGDALGRAEALVQASAQAGEAAAGRSAGRTPGGGEGAGARRAGRGFRENVSDVVCLPRRVRLEMGVAGAGGHLRQWR